MKKIILAVLIIVFVIIIQSCGSTNKLGKYNLSGESILFKTQDNDTEFHADFNDSDIDIDVESVNVILNFAKSLATQYVTKDVEEKLYKAATPEKAGNVISHELQKTMVKYVNIIPVNNFEKNYNYVVTTYIEDIILKSEGSGIYLSVNARCDMRKRHTAELIWEESESETVPLKSYLDDIDKDDYDENLSDVIMLSELVTLSQEQLNEAVELASKKIGREMVEEFIEDLSDSSR